MLQHTLLVQKSSADVFAQDVLAFASCVPAAHIKPQQPAIGPARERYCSMSALRLWHLPAVLAVHRDHSPMGIACGHQVLGFLEVSATHHSMSKCSCPAPMSGTWAITLGFCLNLDMVLHVGMLRASVGQPLR